MIWVFPFIAGIYLQKFTIIEKIDELLDQSQWHDLLYIVCLAVLLSYRYTLGMTASGFRMDCLAAIMLIIGVHRFLGRVNVFAVSFKYLGRYSFSLFLIHMFVSNYYLEKVIYALNEPISMFAATLLLSLAAAIPLDALRRKIEYSIAASI